jgi:hypothetical protein
MDLPKLNLIIKEKSKYFCKFCSTSDIDMFRDLRYTCCKSCESLCSKYRKYYKENHYEGTGNSLLCLECKNYNKTCKKCYKIQEHVQDTTFETENLTYVCKYCKTTNENRFEENRRKMCKGCYNKINNLKYNKNKSEEEILVELNNQTLDIETLSKNFFDLYNRVTKLEEENLLLKSKLTKLDYSERSSK